MKALITGITGQDGSYLAEFLLARGYEVHGLKRRATTLDTDRIGHLCEDPGESDARFFLHCADLSDAKTLSRLLGDIHPDEIYNLACQSDVSTSFDDPEHTAEVGALGALRLLEAIRRTGLECRYYQASAGEIFGTAPPPQRETSPFHPRSPYACAKLFAHCATVNYRESRGMHASCGILFNHESPRRGTAFVTRKITRAVARIKYGLQQKLSLGNLNARRDWGYAPDYVRAMWLMLQQEEPGDYVIGTGEAHSVRDFVRLAFGRAGLDWRQYVQLDPRYLRPCEPPALMADASKAHRVLGWEPSISFVQLVSLMVAADLRAVERTLGTQAMAQDACFAAAQ